MIHVIAKASIAQAYKSALQAKAGVTHDQAVADVAATIASPDAHVIVAEVIAEQPAGWLDATEEPAHA